MEILIIQKVYEVYKGVVDINDHLEIARLKLRLILEFKAVKNQTNLFKIQQDNEEIGKMLGGWIRSLEK